jgi:hypothetical protein
VVLERQRYHFIERSTQDYPSPGRTWAIGSISSTRLSSGPKEEVRESGPGKRAEIATTIHHRNEAAP